MGSFHYHNHSCHYCENLKNGSRGLQVHLSHNGPVIVLQETTVRTALPMIVAGGVGRNHIDSSMHTVYWYTDPLHPHPTQSTTLTTISVTKWVRGGYRAFQCVSLTRIKFHPVPLREDMILCVTGKWRVKGSSGGRRRNSRYSMLEWRKRELPYEVWQKKADKHRES